MGGQCQATGSTLPLRPEASTNDFLFISSETPVLGAPFFLALLTPA